MWREISISDIRKKCKSRQVGVPLLYKKEGYSFSKNQTKTAIQVGAITSLGDLLEKR